MKVRYLAIVAFGLLAAAGGARAETPQILALLETVVPAPLTCRGEVCRAELSAFCLQQTRSAPAAGTGYAFAGGGSLQLVLEYGDGKAARLPAAGELAIESVRGHAAVTVSLPRARLGELGAVAARLEVGEGVSLLPASLVAAGAHDEDLEVLLATGPWRAVGTRVVEAGGGAEVAQVRALNAILNVLPRHDPEVPGAAQAIWADAVSGALAAATPEGLAAARRRLDACGRRDRFYTVTPMQSCLETRHDAVLEHLNQDYWKAVGAGS